MNILTKYSEMRAEKYFRLKRAESETNFRTWIKCSRLPRMIQNASFCLILTEMFLLLSKACCLCYPGEIVHFEMNTVFHEKKKALNVQIPQFYSWVRYEPKRALFSWAFEPRNRFRPHENLQKFCNKQHSNLFRWYLSAIQSWSFPSVASLFKRTCLQVTCSQEAISRFIPMILCFLDASTHLYMRVSPSVGPSIGPLVRPLVRCSVTRFF